VAIVSGRLGVSVAELVLALYVTDAMTKMPSVSRNSKVEAVTVAGSIASLKVAVTAVPVATAVAPGAGL
jgi:hypothetical protein